MCGRFTLHTVRETLARRFRVSVDGLELEPRYNISPTQQVLCVTEDTAEARALKPMRWGLIPPWEPEPTTKLSTINARVETVATSRLYRSAFAKRRCLILADGYYEWQPSTTPGTPKQPFWIHRRDGAPFGFAGIYSEWRPKQAPEATPLLSCSILTMPAFASLAGIHGRMPIILRPDSEANWLAPGPQTPSELTPLLEPDAEAQLTQHPVSRRVNSPRAQGPELIRDAPEAGF